ncbi:MAG TPA: proline dehydrogenase family protein [Acidobacteriota bacterium]|nr:proline dehydrogenase family protein [Acidobacteriota bacterium]
MLRNLMLRIADSPALVGFLSRQGMKTGFARRFVAGESLQEAIPVVEGLNSKGIKCSLDLLGEGVEDEETARTATQSYVNLLHVIQERGVDCNISIKLTQLGLDIGRQVAARNLKKILDAARECGNFVRIDMEGSDYTADTVELFVEHLEIYGPATVGIVIQSYLRRSEEDVRRLASLGCNIRLCKGAYKEPPELAFPKKSQVDDNFVKLMEIMLASPCYSAIATHDEKMINRAQELIERDGVDSSRYEFQMLYGTRSEYQEEIKNQGYRMRVYVPFGTQWAPYFIRRLAERPANVLFVLRNLFKK